MFARNPGVARPRVRQRVVPSEFGEGAPKTGEVRRLAGPNRPSVAVRRWLAPSFRHHPVVVWLTAAAVFLILLAWGPTAGNRGLLGAAILAATTAIAIEALRRQTLREFPQDPPPSAGKPPAAS